MPQVKQISQNKYQYLCECGAEITLETDMPFKKPIRCFSCGKKAEEENKKKSSDTRANK
jgi:predicted SprT family Zn-dependent metalloprotease